MLQLWHFKIDADTEITSGRISPGLLLVLRKPGKQLCIWGSISDLEALQKAIQERLKAPPPWGINQKEGGS